MIGINSGCILSKIPCTKSDWQHYLGERVKELTVLCSVMGETGRIVELIMLFMNQIVGNVLGAYEKMFKYKRISIAAAILVAALITSGCDSDSNGAAVVSETPTDSTADTNADGSAGGEGEATGTTDENSGEDTVDTSDSTDNNGTGNDTNSDTGPVDGSNPDTGLPVVTDDNREFEAMYSARFEASWSAATHPTNFPSDPHFSPLTGAVHNEQVVIWQRGQNATDGIEDMAETGGTGQLLPEIQFAIDQGYALSSIEGGGIPLSPGATSVDFLVNRDYSLVTLVSMLAPSPDWFIGINSLSLFDANGNFVDSLTVELNLYDSGTDGGLRFTSADEDIPRSPIMLVNSFPNDSDFVDGRPSVGSLVFTRIQ